MGIVLIGGAGFVGSHLARRLLDRGCAVTVLDDPSMSTAAASAARLRGARFLEVDLTAGGRGLRAADRPDLRGVDAVVHLANLPLADIAAADRHAARLGIVDITASAFAWAASLAGVRRFTYVSSSTVYGDFAVEPMPETGPCRPCSTYGRLKLEAERLVRSEGLRTGIATTIVRPSAVYGPGDLHGRFIARLVAAALDGTPLRLSGGGAPRLDFTWVGDLAAGIDQATHEPRGANEVFNLTRGEGRSLREAVEIAASAGCRVNVEVDPAPDRLRPARGALDIRHARDLLGYQPRTRLEDGMVALLRAGGVGAATAV